MAKQTGAPVQTLAQVVPFASVVWFKEFNLARPTGFYGTEADQRETYQSLEDQDWLIDDNGIVKVEIIADTLKARAVKEREEQWAELKEAIKTDASRLVELKVFEEMYTEKGKVVPPDYLGLSANRRGSLIFRAKCARRKLNLPVDNRLPVMLMHFDSPFERLEAQLKENIDKTRGLLEMSVADSLLAARKCIQLGGREADLVRIFKRGMSQKLWGVVRLDTLYPNLHIVDRMCLPPTEAGHIGWGVDKEDLRIFAVRSDPVLLESHNNKLVTQGKDPIKPASEEEVSRYFDRPKENSQAANQVKIMSKETIGGLATNFPAMPIRAAFKAVAANNSDGLAPYMVFSTALNALDKLIEQGDGPRITTVLEKLARATGDLRAVMESELLAVVNKHLA